MSAGATPIRIPQANPHASYQRHRTGIDHAIHAVLEKGRYVLGEQVASFETELARAVAPSGTVVGTGSGTDALQLALRACGVRTGDEVITVSHTAVATVAAIELAGATPVLVDVDPATLTMSLPDAIAAIGLRTRAIVPVHLYGRTVDVGALRTALTGRDVLVIEDCAQAAGAATLEGPAGSLGDAAAFSFYPTKNLGALGDGGAAAFRDPAHAARARRLREYGWRDRYVSEEPGLNSRLDELQAAVLRVKLPFLAEENRRRTAIADRYRAALAGAKRILPPPPTAAGTTDAWHLFVVRCPARDELQRFLAERSIGSLVHYPVPVHEQPAYARLRRSLPATERAAREVLSLPLWPEMTDAMVADVCSALSEFDAR